MNALLVKRNGQQARILQRPTWRSAAEKTAHFVREKRRIEANVLENVVVNAVVERTPSAAHNQLLVPQSVPRKTDARSEVVEILIPDTAVSHLETGRPPQTSSTGCLPGRNGLHGLQGQASGVLHHRNKRWNRCST